MHILRKVALGLLSPLFIFLLFATAFDIGFIRTATHPATVKKLVADSGLYDSAVPNLLKQAGTISTPYGELAATNPVVQQAATAAVSPQQVQKQSEAAIDSIYQWLDGKVSQPSFTLGLNDQNGVFATSISAAIGTKLASLPACSNAQSLAIARAGNFDAVNATCLPRGITAASIAGQLNSAIASNQDFLNQASINASDLKSGDSGQSLFQQKGTKDIPKQYQRAKKTPYILALLTILAGAGIVFLSQNWQKGLRHIGINLVIVGVLMLIFAWLLNRTVSTKIAPKIKVDNVVLQTDIRNLVTDIGRQVDDNYRLFGIVYTVLGAAALGGVYARGRHGAAQPAASKVNSSPEPAGKNK
jgi:uncharacterized protein YjeT (DUF2065 family)